MVELVISGRKVAPATVAGLDAMVGRGNFLRPVGGYCDRNGEGFAIEEKASGPKKDQAGWRSFQISYATETIALEDATTLPAAELARRLLPPGSAGKIAGGTLRRQFSPGLSYSAVFWEAPQPVAPMICRRKAYGVRLDNKAAAWNEAAPGTLLNVSTVDSGDTFALSYPAPATSESCAHQTGYVGSRAEDQAATLAVMSRLREAMSLAKGLNALPFQLTCRAEDGDDICADPRAALAKLPLGALMRIEFEPTRYRTTSVTPLGERRRTVVREPDPAAPKISIAAFGPSPPNGKSWRVTLVGAPGELQEVRLGRTAIIYH